MRDKVTQVLQWLHVCLVPQSPKKLGYDGYDYMIDMLGFLCLSMAEWNLKMSIFWDLFLVLYHLPGGVQGVRICAL